MTELGNQDGKATLVRWLEHALRLGSPSQLLIGGSGTVSVYPVQHCYVSDIRDWDSVYSVPVELIRLTPTAWGVPPSGALPLEELHWRAALHEARGRCAAGAAVMQELLQLTSWPNLTRVPAELAPAVARVCALLWRKPTVGYLVARIADVPGDEACAVLQVLQRFGHIAAPRGAAQPQPAAANEEPVTPAPSVAGRFWQRLLGF